VSQKVVDEIAFSINADTESPRASPVWLCLGRNLSNLGGLLV